MKIQEKPDYLIFADSAKNGECVKFPDVNRGWGVTIDQTASKPPLEWMNGAFNRVDKNVMYLLQQGVPEWCEYVKYPVNAIIKYNGVLYTAIVENDNAIPTTSDKWKKTNAETPSASTTQKGVVKLNSAIDSVSEIEAATPLAVKKVNDNTVSAHNRINELHDYAVGVNNNVNYANNRISQVYDYSKEVDSRVYYVNDRVNVITDKFQTDNYESRVYSADKRVYMVIRNDGVMGMYSHVKNDFVWYVNHDGWMYGYITADRIGGLDQFVRDRTLPIGIPQPWPKSTPPDGWLKCNGWKFDTNKYPKLAQAYTSGYLPELRGEFIRGWDDARGVDPYRVILSWQGDAIRNITGNVWPISETFGLNGGTCDGAFRAFNIVAGGTPTVTDKSESGGFSFDASRVVPVAHENRPRSVAFMYIVKAE